MTEGSAAAGPKKRAFLSRKKLPSIRRRFWKSRCCLPGLTRSVAGLKIVPASMQPQWILMLFLIPVDVLRFLGFLLIDVQLIVALWRPLVIASAARRIRPEVNLPILDHSPHNLFLGDAADAFDLCLRVRHLQLEPGGYERFLGLQSFIHRRPATACKCHNQSRRQYRQNSYAQNPFHLLPPN